MNSAAEIIRAEITARGAIPFSRFMKLALYCPVCGFYEKEADTIGRRGDFYTSASVGRLFGELLAFQFAEWLDARPAVSGTRDEGKTVNACVCQIVEAGAHDARLAKDILNWLRRQRPALFERIEYCLVEPSARRRLRQQEILREFGGRVRWFGELSALGAGCVNGVIFSNELLDAMPVQRLGWDAKDRRWFEWSVALDAERFVWTRLAESEAGQALRDLPDDLLDVLPDGFTTEVCPAAERWWREAAGLLARGKLLTLDYGICAEEFFAPQRGQGTLRAYQRHRLSDDVLANAGDQDITAHVNFTAIRAAGESAGLKTEAFDSQAKFLTGIAQRTWLEEGGFGEWTKDRTRQFQTLTHPEHLGRAFRVLVQSR